MRDQRLLIDSPWAVFLRASCPLLKVCRCLATARLCRIGTCKVDLFGTAKIVRESARAGIV